MTSTYVVGFGRKVDGTYEDVFVQFEAESNDAVYPQLANFLHRDYTGRESLDDETPLNIARMFVKAYGIEGATFHRNHIPHSDHTVHLYNPDDMVVILVDTYNPKDRSLTSKVVFVISQWIGKYGY